MEKGSLHHHSTRPLPTFLDLITEMGVVSLRLLHEQFTSHQSPCRSLCLFQICGAELPDGPSCGPCVCVHAKLLTIVQKMKLKQEDIFDWKVVRTPNPPVISLSTVSFILVEPIMARAESMLVALAPGLRMES